jgi:hypothetical protein
MALFAFDGTWNDRRVDDVTTAELETDRNTNVVRFLEAYESEPCLHFKGIGTRAGALGKVVGGMFGAGGRRRIHEALAHARGAHGEPVDIIGFSRGAALALAFANRLAQESSNEGAVPVRFLGLFDVVGAFGIPFDLGPLRFQQVNVGYALTLPPTVQYCFHAMALDERRQTFALTRVDGAHEVWFRGAHSDIGGGNGNVGLNMIALAWMVRKGLACGLPLSRTALDAAAAAADPLAAVRWPDPDPISNRFRTVRPDDLVHHTVMRPCLTRRYNQVPAECPTETADLECAVAGARTIEPVARSRPV